MQTNTTFLRPSKTLTGLEVDNLKKFCVKLPILFFNLLFFPASIDQGPFQVPNRQIPTGSDQSPMVQDPRTSGNTPRRGGRRPSSRRHRAPQRKSPQCPQAIGCYSPFRGNGSKWQDYLNITSFLS